jgi:hypothetical protein
MEDFKENVMMVKRNHQPPKVKEETFGKYRVIT